MDEPKKEPALLRKKMDTKLCLNCGFPNRESDPRCMYCKTSMLDKTGLITWIQQTYYILRWRWQLKQERKRVNNPSKSYLPLVNVLGYLFIGSILSGAGIYLFGSAVTNHSFSSGLIAILFLFYGIFTLKTLFVKK